ncbi:hypothetical protein KJ708_10215 [bacterium]|nr:hypothetical protein [bacterium]MBU1916550.1 hypothetical protein [bacterium]
MKTNKLKVFLNILLALSLTYLASACDSNFAHPDALMTDDSIRIDYFEPELDELTVGQTTTLKWSVIDDEDKIDYCNIEPGIGPVGETNSTDITPSQTTTYTLTVISGGKIVKQQSKIVKVYSPSGDEIVDGGGALAETCDDGIDNDSDTFVDCDDEDCVSDEACADTTFTPEFSYTLSDETPLIGDSVTISWESNYNSLNLYYTQGLADDSEFIKPYQATSSLTFTVEAETTTFKFNAYDSEDNYSGTEEITVTATEEEEDTTNPGFSATKDYFDVYPSVYLIQNEPYHIDWCVRNAASVDMTGDTDHCDEINNLSAGNYATSLYLTATDIYGNAMTWPKSLYVSSFDGGSSFLNATITKMIPGNTSGEYYFITSDNTVYHSTNYLDKTTVVPIVTNAELEAGLDLASSVGIISAFAANDDTYFIGTDKALFVKDADGFKEAVTSDGQTFNSIVVTKNGTVLAGATKNYGTIHAATDETDNDGWDTTLLAFTSYATTDPVRFYEFVVNPNDRSELVALTDKGAFYSTDNGSTFVAKTTDDITVAGFWSEEGKLLIWSHNNVYEWDSSDKRFDEKSALEISSSQINYAVKQKNRYFVATSSGVAVYNPNYEYAEKFYAISGFEVKFLIMGDSDGSFNTPSIHGLTGNGIDYLLEWQSASSYRGIFGTFNLGTFRR